MSHANDVANWLRSLKNTSRVRACRLTIGKQTWEGAAYHDDNFPDKDISFYFVGELPSAKRRRPKSACFRLPDDERDWYVAAYWQEYKEEFARFHKFGINWMLSCWNLPERIDQYERWQYKRFPAILEYLED